jgi:plastocyanin
MGRRNVFIVLVLLVVLGLVIWAILAQKNGSYFGGTDNTQIPGNQTRESISSPVKVPNKGDKAPENVAVPTTQGAAGNNTVSQYRSFNLSVNSSSFSPDTVIAKLGDTVHLLITSSGNYDFTQPDYGLNFKLPAGKTTVVEFQVTATGKYKFYCSSCGGPESGPVGYVVVSP